MKIAIAFVLAFVVSFSLFADPQADTGYGLRSELKKQMAEGHISLGYSNARKHLFGKIHLEEGKNGFFVHDVYCNKNFDGSYGVGPMKIPNHTNINCEHTWPQSKFSHSFDKERQKSDLHHLYPTDSKANSTRGNHEFANVDGEKLPGGCASSRIGSNIRYDEKADSSYFEPPEHHKGNVARALFYFAVRYDMPISATQEQFLRRWHVQDPADAEERERNDYIQSVQGNRNPFIDNAELVDQITDF